MELLMTNRPTTSLQSTLAAGLLLSKPGGEFGSPAYMASA